MKTKTIIILLTLLQLCSTALCQKISQDDLQYRRNSIYSIVIVHKNQSFSNEIFEEFSHIPIPDKYNDHTLSVAGLFVNETATNPRDIEDFITSNKIASRLVAKWFNRDMNTGACDVELVKARGLYNATAFDEELAAHSVRGSAMLEDAGEELIANTYLIVNDVTYIDKNKGAKIAAGAIMVLAALAGAYMDISAAMNNQDTGGSGTMLGIAAGAMVGSMVETLKGFRVRIKTSLYQLVWNDETAEMFYAQHYSSVPDMTKRDRFETDRGKYRLKYLGNVVSRGSETSFLGINEDYPELMIRKACQRAIDENIVDLQRKFECFRVKSPISKAGNNIQIPIGKKEGVNKNSVYEVLRAREVGSKIVYDRVATIKPDPDMIWDNRFMAKEEHAEGADLEYTTFHKVSGGDIQRGMLVRELKII